MLVASFRTREACACAPAPQFVPKILWVCSFILVGARNRSKVGRSRLRLANRVTPVCLFKLCTNHVSAVHLQAVASMQRRRDSGWSGLISSADSRPARLVAKYGYIFTLMLQPGPAPELPPQGCYQQFTCPFLSPALNRAYNWIVCGKHSCRKPNWRLPQARTHSCRPNPAGQPHERPIKGPWPSPGGRRCMGLLGLSPASR
ncbi:hypothetical protein BDP55DRAFT_97480 [Colletotrichum godetiae]|uniref:Uncharacterized protein n=1 Tax=Colletotrichum godetiae TaxID=1209918 RepID=A0AAJ0A4X2_9PEZI|nr:uncharacterized protein BDP55DRAFT_97480 [Colletotrichum godetiae]KAK1656548.1 hypothetical protein BDP55DRAFT_97480 [Colletotrichum godetiae]